MSEWVILSDIPNIRRCIDNIIGNDKYKNLINHASMLLLDISPHNGSIETTFYKYLVEIGYKGILILDDINLNSDMKTFWNGITHTKYDISKYGHRSGTGIVTFNNETQIILE